MIDKIWRFVKSRIVPDYLVVKSRSLIVTESVITSGNTMLFIYVRQAIQHELKRDLKWEFVDEYVSGDSKIVRYKLLTPISGFDIDLICGILGRYYVWNGKRVNRTEEIK